MQAPLAVIEGRPEAFASVIYGGRPLASAVDAADLVVEGDLGSARQFLSLFRLPPPAS